MDLIGGRDLSLFQLEIGCFDIVEVFLRILKVSSRSPGFVNLIVIFLSLSISFSVSLKLITDLELSILSAIKQFSYCNLLYSIFLFFLIDLSQFFIASLHGGNSGSFIELPFLSIIF